MRCVGRQGRGCGEGRGVGGRPGQIQGPGGDGCGLRVAEGGRSRALMTDVTDFVAGAPKGEVWRRGCRPVECWVPPPFMQETRTLMYNNVHNQMWLGPHDAPAPVSV